MNKGYGILFSEFETDGATVENILACLECIRIKLINKYPNKSFEFDIVKVTSHTAENSYPEIGVHVRAGEISDIEFREMELFVLNETRAKNPNIEASKLPKNEVLTWGYILENGVYPKRT